MAKTKVRNTTEMIERIVLSEWGRKMLNMIAPCYGNSYAMLSIFQAVGVALDEVQTYVDDFFLQTSPVTATWSINIWEESVGIVPSSNDFTYDLENRREAVIKKLWERNAMPPEKLAQIAKVVSGVNVGIIENTSPDKFAVDLPDFYDEEAYYKLKSVIDRLKPGQYAYEFWSSGSIKNLLYIALKLGISRNRLSISAPESSESESTNNAVFVGVAVVRTCKRVAIGTNYTTYGDLDGLRYSDLDGLTFREIEGGAINNGTV